MGDRARSSLLSDDTSYDVEGDGESVELSHSEPGSLLIPALHTLEQPLWVGVVHTVIHCIGILLFLPLLCGAVILYKFYYFSHPAQQFAPSLYLVCLNLPILFVTTGIIATLKRNPINKDLTDFVLIISACGALVEAFTVACAGYGLFGVGADFFLAFESTMQILLILSHTYLILFRCSPHPTSTESSNRSVKFCYYVLSFYLFFIAIFRVINYSSQNAVDYFQKFDIAPGAAIYYQLLVFPVCVHFYVDAFCHLWRLKDQLVPEYDHDAMSINRGTGSHTGPFTNPSEQSYWRQVIKCTRSWKETCAAAFGIALVSTTVIAAIFMMRPGLIPLHVPIEYVHRLVVVVQTIVFLLLAIPLIRLWISTRGLNIYGLSIPVTTQINMTKTNQLIFLWSTLCIVWFDVIILYETLEHEKSDAVHIIDWVLGSLVSAMANLLQCFFYFSTICIQETPFTRCLKILLPVYNLCFWVLAILIQKIILSTPAPINSPYGAVLGDIHVGIFSFLFPFVLMFRFFALGYSIQHFKEKVFVSFM